MTGVRLSGVYSPDGQWLYSLYAREHKGAFIHALNLKQPFAFCLDLPGSGYLGNMNGLEWSIAIAPDGAHVYAANGPMGLVTRIDNLDGQQPSIASIERINPARSTAGLFVRDVAAKQMGRNAAVVSNDGKTLVTAGANGLIWIDTRTLQVRNRALTNWSVWGLAATPDGAMLYALNDAGAIAEISMASGKVVATFNPDEGYPMGLLRVEAA
jgi:DNA-binding beta-propeller fold protein YncE